MELKDLRNKIDSIDERLLPLFLERMKVASEVARIKAEQSLPILNRSREREILAAVTQKSEGMERYAHRLYTEIFELSRAYQGSLLMPKAPVTEAMVSRLTESEMIFPSTGTVACQGVEGAYSGMAADRIFPRGNIVYFKSFEAVFDAVESGLCSFGVVPLENSTNGSVRKVVELLCRKRVSVVRSARLCIRHELLARKGIQLSEVTEIYSHSQAIGQCSEFLASLGDKVKIVPCENTAVAAEAVSKSDRPCAAIASHNSAKLYGLNSLGVNIGDSENNYTRFLCITKDEKVYAGADRIALIISLEHKPGALYEALAKLSAHGVNLIKLESYPKPGSDFEFMFYFEMEASLFDKDVVSMLADMERESESFRILGNYSEI